MGAVTYPTLEHVASQARPYPTYLLEHAETGLCLFAAAFLGHNDAVHFALEDVQTTCVDTDSDRLEEMAGLYPEVWRFVCEDAWAFAERKARDKLRYDVVSVDTFTGDATRRSLDSLELWCSISRAVVTATITLSESDAFVTPKGWRSSLFQRAGNVYWLVLEKT